MNPTFRDFAVDDGPTSGGGVAEMLERVEAHYFIDCSETGSTRIVVLLDFRASRGVVD